MSVSSFWEEGVSAGRFLPACPLLRLEGRSSSVATVNGLGVTLQGRSTGWWVVLCMFLPVKPRLGLHLPLMVIPLVFRGHGEVLLHTWRLAPLYPGCMVLRHRGQGL